MIQRAPARRILWKVGNRLQPAIHVLSELLIVPFANEPRHARGRKAIKVYVSAIGCCLRLHDRLKHAIDRLVDFLGPTPGQAVNEFDLFVGVSRVDE
jgi:hypothetical protein